MMSRLSEKTQGLDLPPGYDLVTLRELGDAFSHAVSIAGKAGAGTLVWTGRYDLVEFALVLEPDEPLTTARRALFICMNALADAIASHCPPEREVTFGFPDAIYFDRGLLGGAQFAWPQDCGEAEVPEWLVFGAMLRAADLVHMDSGEMPDGASLMAEGFEMVETDAIVESFARHLMTGFDQWREYGFDPAARAYLERVPTGKAGELKKIDRNGDLLIRLPAERGPPQRTALIETLASLQWYDARHRGPKFR